MLGKMDRLNSIDRIALILIIIGALNWGSIGLFQYDVVLRFWWVFFCCEPAGLQSCGSSGVYAISLLFRRELRLLQDNPP